MLSVSSGEVTSENTETVAADAVDEEQADGAAEAGHDRHRGEGQDELGPEH